MRFLFFFKQKTAYEMRISDWSSDVCSSDLRGRLAILFAGKLAWLDHPDLPVAREHLLHHRRIARLEDVQRQVQSRKQHRAGERKDRDPLDSQRRGFAHQPNRISDSRRRCAATHGSSSPTASNSDNSLARAASSFHSRSAATMCSRLSAAASRCPAPICAAARRSEEHTSELQSLMRISSSV